MINDFKIYLDRLKGGAVHTVEGTYTSDLLEIEEDEIHFHGPVAVRGEAYMAEETLIIHLAATTVAEMPCAICNEWIKKPLSVVDYVQAAPLSEIRGSTYDFGIVLREALLLEIPYTAECNEGKCPARQLYKLGE